MDVMAVFGITNDGLNLVVSLLILFLIVLWLALVYWTNADARRRIEDPMLIGCATAASLFPFAGTVVYLVVRPPEYLEDVHERELEIAASEARLHAAQGEMCPYCEHPVETSFLRCPSCTRRLRQPCGTCGKPLDPRWRLCPYCEAEVEGAVQQRPARRERRRERPPEQPVAAEAPKRKASKPSAAAEAPRRKAPADGIEPAEPTRPRRTGL